MADDAVTVSVVIPAYNAAATLARQLEAFEQQRVSQPWELIVADNGSTDDTRAVAEGWAVRIPALRVVDAGERRGASAARNLGAAAARGDLLLFCDADDVIERDWVERMASSLAHHDLVGGVLETRTLRRPGAASVSWEANAEIRLHYWTRYEAASGSNLGIRRGVFEELGGFDEHLVTGEDVDLCWRAQLGGRSFGRVHDAVVKSRPRIGLQAVYRQAYSYGEGHRQLRRKYEAFIAAESAEEPPRLPPEPPASAPADRGRVARRLRRLFTASGLADLTWRLGETLGERFTHADRQVVPLVRRG